MKAYRGRRSTPPPISLQHRMQMSGSIHVLVALSSGKETRFAINRKSFGPKSHSGIFAEKSLASTSIGTLERPGRGRVAVALYCANWLPMWDISLHKTLRVLVYFWCGKQIVCISDLAGSRVMSIAELYNWKRGEKETERGVLFSDAVSC
jgi:hypothetical protein